MHPVKVKGIVIGEGIPKICVPIMAETAEQVVQQAKILAPLTVGAHRVVDLVEWRADSFLGILEQGRCREILTLIRSQLPEIPLLFTFRTKEEGGVCEADTESYLQVSCEAVESGLIDLVDVELFTGDNTVRQIVETAHAHGEYVVCSNHDFHATPSGEELTSRLRRMDSLGADILKIAAMPCCSQDVLTLLSVTAEMSAKLSRPLITMSMSQTGVISRLCGETFGSSVTFGALGTTSAPGQIDAVVLKNILQLLHSENK